MSHSTTVSAEPAAPAAPPADIDSTGCELVPIPGMRDDSPVAITLAGQTAFRRFTLGAPGTTPGPGTVRVPC